ncbi:MAG: hypothetical protein M5U28_28100 [Sandaracinaceae bacterium]|nr:hypothetical protein [Sandaracinaceae bacterium]
MTAPITIPREPVIRCPACGNAGERGAIRYIVDVTSWAEVLRERGGVLELSGPLRPSMQDAPAHPRLECWAVRPAPDNRVCGHRWELPAVIRGLVWRVRSCQS